MAARGTLNMLVLTNEGVGHIHNRFGANKSMQMQFRVKVR